MGERLNLKLAEEILIEEVNEARQLPINPIWENRISSLRDKCQKQYKTFIAALGTALLAKATDLSVDPFALQAGEGERSYSARTLCKEVLAAKAATLGIDLGVTGPEPLNNSPFYRETRITEKLRAKNRDVLLTLLEVLREVDGIRTEREARMALRTFLQLQVKAKDTIVFNPTMGELLSEAELLQLVSDFCKLNSENGRRAQAVASGLLDAMYDPKLVKTGRVNDPSRRMPGDVVVYSDTEHKVVCRSFEVRDKPVSDEDVKIFIDRGSRAGLGVMGIVAIANVNPLNEKQLLRYATERSVRFRFYFGWAKLVEETLFWSRHSALCVGEALRAIIQRAIDIEVSQEGIDLLVERGGVAGVAQLSASEVVA